MPSRYVICKYTVCVTELKLDGAVYAIGKVRVSGFNAARVQSGHCWPPGCDVKLADVDETMNG